MAWRNAYEEMRNYDAGNLDRINSHWRVTNDSAEVTDRYSREWVRARARDLERNSDIMNSVLGAYKRNVIGSGFQIQAKTPKTGLNKDLEQLWKKWCKARNCDVTGQQSLNQMLRMAVVRKKVDGGVLFVKRYTKDGMMPFSLQMIEVDELDTTQVVPRDSKNRVVGGIEYNEYNRPTGYWVKQYAIDGYTIADTKYIKADDVIFYFSKKRPSQIREMSGLLFDDFEPERFDQICHAIDIDSGIFSKTGKAVSKLSDGNQTKLMLACVFARKTELLLLDEPASPLDPLMRDTLSDMIRRYIAEGDGSRSVLFSTHNITDMESVTDYVLIMEQGQIVEQGFVLDLKEKYIVVKGDADDTEAARPYLLTCQSNSYGFEGVCLADQLDRLAGTHIEVETPSLFQISVAVMKQNSRLTIPDIA